MRVIGARGLWVCALGVVSPRDLLVAIRGCDWGRGGFGFRSRAPRALYFRVSPANIKIGHLRKWPCSPRSESYHLSYLATLMCAVTSPQIPRSSDMLHASNMGMGHHSHVMVLGEVIIERFTVMYCNLLLVGQGRPRDPPSMRRLSFSSRERTESC